jgi:hypothetical protein
MASAVSIFYETGNSTDPIVLTITVGEAQWGATIVRKGRELIIDSEETRVVAELGPANELKRSKILCTTTVQDVNEATNRTSVTWHLAGGKRDLEKTKTETVDHDGDTALYAATIYLL